MRQCRRTYPYYKVAVWDAMSIVWRDGKIAFASRSDAEGSVVGTPGKYRVSEVTESKRYDLEPFLVT